MRAQTDRLDQFLDNLVAVLGHWDRQGPCRDYCLGLLLDGGRKSMEPMAARLAPASTGARHQQLQNFVTYSRWSDEAVLTVVRDWVLPELTRAGPLETWIVDDTGFPKKGKASVGVARQYCGQLGKQDNCQVAVSLSVANVHGSLPVAYRLYLPQDWASDAARREKVGGSPKTWCSRPSRRSRWIRSGRRSLRACRRGFCWQMPLMGTTPISVKA